MICEYSVGIKLGSPWLFPSLYHNLLTILWYMLQLYATVGHIICYCDLWDKYFNYYLEYEIFHLVIWYNVLFFCWSCRALANVAVNGGGDHRWLFLMHHQGLLIYLPFSSCHLSDFLWSFSKINLIIKTIFSIL